MTFGKVPQLSRTCFPLKATSLYVEDRSDGDR